MTCVQTSHLFTLLERDREEEEGKREEKRNREEEARRREKKREEEKGKRVLKMERGMSEKGWERVNVTVVV